MRTGSTHLHTYKTIIPTVSSIFKWLDPIRILYLPLLYKPASRGGSLDPLCFYFSDLKWSCRHCLSCCPPLLCRGHGLPRGVTWITAPPELLSASSYQDITATNGQPASLMHTYSKKVTRSIFVKIAMQHIAGTSAWLRCMTNPVEKWQMTVHVNLAIRLLNHTLVFLLQHCLQNATARPEIHVIGTETAWKRSTHAKIPAMRTLSNTLRSFVDYTVTDIPY